MTGRQNGRDRDPWPLKLTGVTETVVTTRGPNGRWNAAALGVHAPESDGRPRARTYGNTRTRKNFRREGAGYVQFTDDPVLFVEAALSIHESDDPVLPETGAWVRVDVERVGVEGSDGTRIETWALDGVESEIVAEQVPHFDRGRAAVVEATIAASRLDVSGFDTGTLRERLRYFEETAEKCGGPRVHEAVDRLNELVERPDTE